MAELTSKTACVACFHNEGVQRLAEQHGVGDKGACQLCGSKGRAKLGQAEVLRVMEVFFGDRSAESRLEPGLFFLGDDQPPDTFRDVAKDFTGAIKRSIVESEAAAVSTLEQTARHDYALLSRLTGFGLRLYAGRGWFALDSYWRLEFLASLAPERVPTYERERRDLSNPRPPGAMFDLITATWPSKILRAKDALYRVGRSPSDRLNVLQYDAPPSERIAAGGRFNGINHPALYAAFDVDTCLAEMKIVPEDVVNHALFIARLEVLQDLHVLDLTLDADLLSRGGCRGLARKPRTHKNDTER
jgi:RES domain